VVKGHFRKDLYYRLNIVELKLPSLSERREDIPLLIRHFIEKYNKQMNRHIKDIDPYLEEKLIHRNWKGEVRELENTIERLMIFASGDKLSLKDLPSFLQDGDQSDFMNIRASSLKLAQEYFEKKYINQVLERNAYHKGNTARELKIGEATLYRKLKEYGIEK
jgi:DNA-binding NtrC family response regulator